MAIDALLNNFAIRSFRNIADGDYITARLAYRGRMLSQFLWSGQQAVEKYLKCILLLNRIKAKKVRHDLSLGLRKIENSGKLQLRLSDVTRDFITYLDTYGKYRYFESPYYTKGAELVYLDKTVWELRRYCTKFNPKLIEQSEKDAPQKFSLPGGHLEKIIADPTQPGRAALIWHNLFFGKKTRKAVRPTTFFQAENPPLTLHPHILEELLKYVYLPPEVIQAYKTQDQKNRRQT